MGKTAVESRRAATAAAEAQFRGQVTHAQPPAAPQEVFSVGEAARHLMVGEPLIRRAHAEGRLERFQQGPTDYLTFTRAALAEFRASHLVTGASGRLRLRTLAKSATRALAAS